MADDILKNIPLPADLPENWTSGQIVAPTGAEAGLDDQHGYNYLMRQVNNAQKALKALAAQREEDLARIKFWVSDDPTSPASFIGGTWEQIKDSFILAAGDTYAAGSTGGEARHTLTKSELPRIREQLSGFTAYNANAGGTDGVLSFVEEITLSNVQPGDSTKYATLIMSLGDSQPHNNIPPYYSAYIWRRVA